MKLRVARKVLLRGTVRSKTRRRARAVMLRHWGRGRAQFRIPVDGGPALVLFVERYQSALALTGIDFG